MARTGSTFIFASTIALPGVTTTGQTQTALSVAFGDFNEDANDLATQSRASGFVYVALGAGNGKFGVPLPFYAGTVVDPFLQASTNLHNWRSYTIGGARMWNATGPDKWCKFMHGHGGYND